MAANHALTVLPESISTAQPEIEALQEAKV
jgi:hypothetical protein